MKLDIQYLIDNMTLEEKAGLCSGADSWRTKAAERPGLPQIMVSDGPHGLRKQVVTGDNLGLNSSVKAVCFPAGSALASSFDRELTAELGKNLGNAARAEKLHTVLGPAMNIKRSPLCGRNFEYLSEDPYLAGEMAAEYTLGVQSEGVGVSLKHFAANNQEYRRMSTDTIVSERALREIYLSAFETAVKKADPWTIMCAYNRINGAYCCENEWLLNDVLREEWGFDGIVMTDWGAMNDRVNALKAGLELEMPSSFGLRDAEIVDAVNEGRLTMEELDKAVERLLRWITKGEALGEGEPYDLDAQHEFARRAAAECAVLLKNENRILPLKKDENVVFVGSFASEPRFQGGGSSHINTYRVESAADAAPDIPHYPGWSMDGEARDEAALSEALNAAKNASVAVIFAGLPDSFESEGYDRTHLNMPECQNELIKAVAQVQPNTVVILHAGSPVIMPWINDVAAVMDMYLGGEAVGAAAVDLIFGDAEPSGRLAETFPQRLEDTPSYLNFPGDGKKVTYAEDVFVGYRWYDTRKIPVQFPFGFGLSYTDFEIKDIMVTGSIDEGEVEVTVFVKNTGKRAGKHVVQLYVAPPEKTLKARPAHELKGFSKVELQPGEEKLVAFSLDKRSFSYYNEEVKEWLVDGGAYTIEVGSSSRDIEVSAEITAEGDKVPFIWDDCITVGEILDAGKGAAFGGLLDKVREHFGLGEDGDGITDAMRLAMIKSLPVHSLASFVPMEKGFEEKIRIALEETE